MTVGWSVVVPVKGTIDAKSRLGDDLSARERSSLGLAFAHDTVEAAAGSARVARVYVVTDADAEWPAVVFVVPEGERHGLNAAIVRGIHAAESSLDSSAPGAGITVLLGDLPALRSEDLDAALMSAEEVDRGFVPDAEGTGTTVLTARAGVSLEPRFGAGSAAAHAALGHVRLDAGTSLRRDVDVPAALEEAVRLGVGERTRAALELRLRG
ncbi:2-phospho-L-lactate guanylyltransferase [Leifsonia sp. YIM 134122]|uniref:Phosphoenolpyruvate guanylyltransferase n=1 Tax=Leifsonia stereocauli TaxID=3134136 RepID=A0ABU9W404_9MICO